MKDLIVGLLMFMLYVFIACLYIIAGMFFAFFYAISVFANLIVAIIFALWDSTRNAVKPKSGADDTDNL